MPERREGDMAEHIDAILCTMALLCVEVGIDEVHPPILCFTFCFSPSLPAAMVALQMLLYMV